MKNVKRFTPEEIKEIRSRISVSVDNTGRFIRETRLQHHLSQSSLGSVLYVTKKAVSKWERGLCYPSMDVLPYLAETLGVTTDEILYAKFDTENKYEDSSKALKLINRIFKNKYVRFIKKTIIVLALIFLVWFFIENYNAVKIYTLRTNDDYVHLEKALLVTTKQSEYLNLGYTYLDFPDIDEKSQVNYTIYIGNENKINRIIQEFVSKNFMLYITNPKDKEYPQMKIEDNFDNLYLTTTYIDKLGQAKEHTVKLYISLKYQSNDVLHIFKDINDRLITNYKLPNLNEPKIAEIDNDLTIDLSFLYNMTDEERKERYDSKSFILNNNKISIENSLDYIRIKNEYEDYKIALNENLLYINYNKLTRIFKIYNRKIIMSQSDISIYNAINDIIIALKN